jgi:peptide/nickel transport system substrate-binding protein
VESFESNVKTVMVRNDAYWGGTKGRPAVFQHHYVPDGRARLNAVRSGQATVALIDPRQIPEAKSAGLAVQINEKNGVWDIYINLGKTPMKDLKVRQAFMHAIDREALADALSFGSSKPTVQFFAQSSPVYDPALERIYPYDPAKAKALLAEAGYKDGIDLTQLLLNTTEYKQLGEALQAMLAESNIRIKFDVVDASQFNVFRRPPYRGDYLMARWGGRADPLQVFQELIATGASYNPSGVASPEIDTLIAKARGMLPSDPERILVLRQIARVSVENAAQAPLMTRSNIYAFREGCILNLTPYLPFGDDRFNDVQVSKTCK